MSEAATDPLVAALVAEVRALRGEVAELRQVVRPVAWPAQLTRVEAMQFLRVRSRSAFYRKCRRLRIRPLSRNCYALTRLQAALANGGGRR